MWQADRQGRRASRQAGRHRDRVRVSREHRAKHVCRQALSALTGRQLEQRQAELGGSSGTDHGDAAAAEAAAAAEEAAGVVLADAHERTSEPGSATIILAVQLPGGRLSVANLGDCGLRVVRSGRIHYASQVRSKGWLYWPACLAVLAWLAGLLAGAVVANLRRCGRGYDRCGPTGGLQGSMQPPSVAPTKHRPPRPFLLVDSAPAGAGAPREYAAAA